MSSQCGRTGAMWRRLIRSLWILSRHCKWKHLADGWWIFRSWSSINTRLIVRGWPSHHHQLAVSCHNYTLDNYELDNYSNPVRNPFSRRCSRYFVVACLCSPLHFTSLFSPSESAVCKSSWKNSITISTSILWSYQTEWPSSSSASDHGSKQYKWKRSSGRQNSNPCPSLFKRPRSSIQLPAANLSPIQSSLGFKSFSFLYSSSLDLSCCTLARSQPQQQHRQ